jgi:hypothetical protein
MISPVIGQSFSVSTSHWLPSDTTKKKYAKYKYAKYVCKFFRVTVCLYSRECYHL